VGILQSAVEGNLAWTSKFDDGRKRQRLTHSAVENKKAGAVSASAFLFSGCE